MPIRFRCRHCRQNLGISRAKAGEDVDCPTCGRSIRVPPTDGQADEAGRPQMNFRDPAIAKAMAEIQSLSEVKPKRKETPSSDEVSIEEPDEQRPIVLSEPDVQPPPVLEITPHSSEKKSRESRAAGVVASEETSAERNRKELERLAAQAEEIHDRSKTELKPLQLSIPAISGLVLGFGLLMGLGIGYLVYDPETPESDPSINSSSQEPGETDSVDSKKDGTDQFTIQGVITYDPENAATRPDTQSLIVLLAESPRGQVKIPGESLWEPEDSPDFEVAAATLELIGGRAALTDRAGRFSLAVPKAGSYHLVVVSRHALRENTAVDSSLEAVLKKYFEQPRQLLGRRAYHVEMLTVDGSRLNTLRHRFK